MSRADVPSTTPTVPSDRALVRPLPVLIEVPQVKCRGANLARTRAVEYGGARPAWAPRRKRRLRREVRIAGCALLAMGPLLSVCTLGWSSRPARVLACSIGDSSPSDRDFSVPTGRSEPAGLPIVPPAGPLGIIVSIDQAGLAADSDAAAPIVFPGYVLPDDSIEGLAHEGS
jgi:hypothetical protein